MKAAEDAGEALIALVPRLRELAVLPIGTEEELVEREAFYSVLYRVQLEARYAGFDPSELVEGWNELFRTLTLEVGRAHEELEKQSSPAVLLERNRQIRASAVSDPMPPTIPGSGITVSAASTPAARPAFGGLQLRMAEVLTRFLDFREIEDGDRRAQSDVAPIVQFAIDLLGDPVMWEITGDHLLSLKQAIPDIPTLRGFAPGKRESLYFRWKYVRDNGWSVEREGKTLQFRRVSETTIRNRYRAGLQAFWQFAIEHRFAAGPPPDFAVTSKKNPPAQDRDAFELDELLRFFSAPPFTGCSGRNQTWTPGLNFFQGYFYWGELISLLCGLRPGETAQLKCRDILDLYGHPHIRFARQSAAEEAQLQAGPTEPGGQQGKTPNAYRWVPIHWLLLRLGLLDRRDAIVADYAERELREAGGRENLSAEQVARVEADAADQWLFPDWPVYVKNTGEIKWAHALTKAFRYGITKLEMNRAGLVQYSARHTFKGFIDDIRDLSERTRLVVMGHSTKRDVSSGYGPKKISNEQSAVIQRLSNRAIWRVALILVRAKRRAERGALRTIDAWRIDERSSDEKFQAALARRSEQYR